MSKIKNIILFVPTIFLLIGCGSDAREYYLEQIEELDRGDLQALNEWLDDNEESMDELFDIVNIRVDLEGNELESSQSLGLDSYYFDSWSFAHDDDTLTFTYTWDYEAATAVEEALEEEEISGDADVANEILDAMAADNEMLAGWVDEIIVQFEDINVEDPLFFTTTIGGFLSGSRSAIEDLNVSVYALAQIDNVLSFIDDVQGLVIQNLDDDDLDLEEARDIMIETLEGMRDTLLEATE